MVRRSLLSVVVAAGGLFIAGVVGIPALLVGLSPALKSRRETWRSLGRLGSFAVGAVQAEVIPLDRSLWPRSGTQRAVFVWRRSETDVVVFSRSCTDLGCALNFDAGSRCYFCPCHGGIFSHDGERMAGPPKRPMDRYVHRIRDGVIEVDVASIPPAA